MEYEGKGSNICSAGCRCVSVAATADDESMTGQESLSSAFEELPDDSAVVEPDKSLNLLPEKRDVAIDRPTHALERRHNYGLVCDINVAPTFQRRVTNECRTLHGYGCDSAGASDRQRAVEHV